MKNKDQIDWQALESSLNPAPTAPRYAFPANEKLFRKVAFDVYEKIGDVSLWEMRESETGEKHLVALYDDVSELPAKTAAADAGVWSAATDSKKQNVTLFVRNHPIYRFAAAEFGFAPENADKFASYLVNKAKDPAFVDSVLGQVPARTAVIARKLIG